MIEFDYSFETFVCPEKDFLAHLSRKAHKVSL